MHSVLFVDDETSILNGLQRALRGQARLWKMHFAQGGAAALKILEAGPVDVIVSDMRMPEMSGNELLDAVRDRYPQTIRIILSGHSDDAMVLGSVRSAHQFLAKPCSSEVIRQTLERALALRDMLHDKRLLSLITGFRSLPGRPLLYDRLVTEIEKPDVSLDRLGGIVADDATMSARLLQLVNSAFFGLPRQVVDIGEAVKLLGLNLLRSLVLTVHAFDMCPQAKMYTREIEALWQHGSQVAKVAREIAESMNLQHSSLPEQCFVAGMLHDLGKLLLLQMSGYAEKVLKPGGPIDDELQREHTFLGQHGHAEVGAYLLGLWGLPSPIVEAIAWHHRPGTLPSPVVAPLTCVHVADALVFAAAADRGRGPGDSVIPGLDLDYLKILKLADQLPGWRDIATRVVARP